MVFKEITVDIGNVYPYFFQKHDISSDYKNIFLSTLMKLRLEEERLVCMLVFENHFHKYQKQLFKYFFKCDMHDNMSPPQ